MQFYRTGFILAELVSDDLRASYEVMCPVGHRLINCLREQLTEILESAGIALGTPIEARVKSLTSIDEKISRKGLVLESIEQLDDIVGVRLIILFKEDLDKIKRIIKANFDLISYEDTSTRLGDSQFGYQSDHFIIRIKEDWESIPTYKGLRTVKAEIQVRTMAQHIWAAASHKLQYKQEENVAQPLRRSINRVSALLETVDFELNRLVAERRNYIDTFENLSSDAPLDVDIVAKILAENWPAKNLSPSEEEYNGLVSELRHFGIENSRDLRALLNKHVNSETLYEQEVIENVKARTDLPALFTERASKGFYFTQVALTRGALRREFGEEEVDKVVICSSSPKPSKRRKRTPRRTAASST